MNIIEEIKQTAKADKQKIILPEGTDSRVTKAAKMVLDEGFADIILVGNKDEILKTAGDLDLSGASFVDPLTSEKFDHYVEMYYEMRKTREPNLTKELAKERLKDPVYYGMMMVKFGEADGLVSGAIHSTADTLRPALQIIKTAPGVRLVSSFFLMVVPNPQIGENGVLLFADCGLNENPNPGGLAEIAITSARTLKNLLGITPRVAMLSYSTYGSADSELTQKVVRAVALAKQKAPDILIDGELQVDAALIPSVAKIKAPDSPLGGRANVLIFPDINAGNIGYKLVERLANAQAYGPITQGLAKPVNDLSRGCKAEDIVGVVAITAVQAQMNKKQGEISIEDFYNKFR